MEAIDSLLGTGDKSQFDRIVLGELVQMRDEHLPKLLRSYVEVPPQYRKEIFKNTGRSASFLLEEALAGQPDQRFTLDPSTTLTNWFTGPLFEFLDSTGTLLLLDSPSTNQPPMEFFRAPRVP